MRILVIGAVAAGTSAATKARRNNDTAEIVIYEKDSDISYSACGLPYFIGGEVHDIHELTPRNPDSFKKKYNIDILTGHEVLDIKTDKKQLEVKNLKTGEVFFDTYDTLVIATGAYSFKPKIEGIDNKHVFFLRNVKDALLIKEYIEQHNPKNAVITGTGFIGFELLESLFHNNIHVSMLEIADKITPNLDFDTATYLEDLLVKKGIRILKNTSISKIEAKTIMLSNNTTLEADMLIMATGVRPQVELAKKAGIEIGITGAIQVNKKMQTNIKDIYSCGDCAETYSSITGKVNYRPLGSTANKTGRIVGDNITGGNIEYKGNLSTSIFRLFDLCVASTGLSEKEAKAEGFDIVTCHNIKADKPDYMNGGEMLIKAIADKKDGRLLGVQIIGTSGVDKRIDVFATLITYKAHVDELFHIDLAYAPPFSTAKDPVHYTGMILDNALNKGRELITTDSLSKLGNDIQVVDARSHDDYNNKGCVEDAVNIPHTELRDKLSQLDKDKTTITYCNKGVTGNAAQNILINNGFEKVYNLSGGHTLYKSSKK